MESQPPPSQNQPTTAAEAPIASSSTTTTTTPAESTSTKTDHGFNLRKFMSFDHTLQSIKGKLGLDDKKPEDNEKTQQTTGTEENVAGMESEKKSANPIQSENASEKKESGFHRHFIAPLDDTFNNIKGKLGLEEKKSNETDKSEKSAATDEKATSNQPETETASQPDASAANSAETTASEKKESGFHLNIMSSLDNTFSNIKGKLGLDEKKPNEDATGDKTTASQTGEAAANTSEATTPSEKKESGFHLPLISSLDGTFSNIKEKLGLDEKKPNEETKAESSDAASEKTASTDPATTDASEKKESGFHLNIMSSLDNTFSNIKGKLGLDEKKSDDEAKGEQSGATSDKTTASQTGEAAANASEATTPSEKKESGFHLNIMSSLDNTFSNIKGKLGLDEKKSDDEAKGEQSGATTEKAGANEPDTKNSAEKKESGFHLPKMPSFDNTFHNIFETIGLEKAKSADAEKSAQEGSTPEKAPETSPSADHVEPSK